MSHSAVTFYKEDEETRRMMDLEPLGLSSLGMGAEMEMEMGMGITMDVRMTLSSDTTTTTTTTILKEEEEAETGSCARQAETTLTTLTEPQFIFEFPGQDDEDANNRGSHDTTSQHEITLPPSDNFVPAPPSFSLSLPGPDSFVLHSFLESSATYNPTCSTFTSATGTTAAALLPLSLDEHHRLLGASPTAGSSSLRPGSPTTEAMRSMMSVFRVDPFASYDADPGLRRKRRKRGSSYAMLSDPEQTSREEPLMFTFQIEANPGSEYYENYHHQYHHHLSDIGGPSSAMILDSLSTPSPQSSPSLNILPSSSAEYYQQPSTFQQDNSAGQHNPFFQSSVEPDDLSNMILGSAGGASAVSGTTPVSGRSIPALNHPYGYIAAPTRQSHHQQTFHDFDLDNNGHHSQHLIHHHHSEPNPPMSTAYMLQNMRQSMGMNLDNMNSLSVQNLNIIGMDSASTNMGYQTTTTAAGPSNTPVQRSVVTNIPDVNIVNPPPMDSLQMSHMDGIIDHFRSREGNENPETQQWATHPLTHSAHSQSRHSYYHHSRSSYIQSQNRIQGFGDAAVVTALGDIDVAGEVAGVTDDAFSPKINIRTLRNHVPRQIVESEYLDESKVVDGPCSQNELSNDIPGHHEHSNQETESQSHDQRPNNGPKINPFSVHPNSTRIGIDAGEKAGIGPSLVERAEGTTRLEGSPAEIRNSTPTYSSPFPQPVILANDPAKAEKQQFVGRHDAEGSIATPYSNSDQDSRTGSGTRTPSQQIPELGEKGSRESKASRKHDWESGSFSIFQDEVEGNDDKSPNSVYSDARELFLPKEYDITDACSTPSAAPTVQIDTLDTGLHTRASSRLSSHQTKTTSTATTTYRLNAAQFDPDPDLDLDSPSASDADFQEVDMIAVKTPVVVLDGDNNFQTESIIPTTANLNLAVGSSSLRAITQTGLYSASESGYRDVGRDAGQIVFPTCSMGGLAKSILNSKDTVPRSDVANFSGSNCCDDRDIDSECVFTGTGMTTTFSQSQSQIDSEQQENWRPFDDTTTTSDSRVSHAITSSHLYVESQSHTATNAIASEQIDYVHSRQYQDGRRIGDDGILVIPLHKTTHFPPSRISPYVFPAGTEGSRKHICWICQKEFPRPSGLATHMNTHSGLKPYRCPIPTCSKTFAVRSNARRHLRIHGSGANQNLIFESPGIRDLVFGTAVDNSCNNSPFPHESSESLNHPCHPCHPSSYSSPPVSPAMQASCVSSSPIPPESHISSSRTRRQVGNEDDCNRYLKFGAHRDASTITTGCSLSSSLRHQSNVTNDMKGLPNYPYRKPYKFYPSLRLLDDFASGSTSLASVPYAYNQSSAYQYENQDSKPAINLMANDSELYSAESEFYSSELWHNQKLNEEAAIDVGKFEETEDPDLDQLKCFPNAEIYTATKDNDNENCLVSLISTSEFDSAIPITNYTRRSIPTSTYASHRSISDMDMDTPTLSTISTVSIDSDDLDNTVATASINIDDAHWTVSPTNTILESRGQNHDAINEHNDVVFGGAVPQPTDTNSLRPSSALSLSVCNFIADIKPMIDPQSA